MKTLLKISVITLIILASAVDLGAWGRNGHNAIAAIAEQHLTKKTKKAVEQILEGKSIIYWANWMDYVRTLPDYKYTTNWHVNYADEQGKIVIADKHGKNGPDALWGLHNQVLPVLENREGHTPEEVSENLKYLIHLIGDIHCPSHVYYANHNGSVKLLYRNEPTGHHRIWDSTLIDDFNGWAFSDYVFMLDRASRKEIAKICEGTVDDWVAQCAVDCEVIYSWINEEKVADPEYKLKAVPFAEKQIQMAGYRLAHILNELFD